jgi:hypothetical protein
MRVVTESPENWVILKIDGVDGVYYRVFGGWRGGYAGSDRWKMNSGIVKVESDSNYYYFIGASGSCYKCHKESYGGFSGWVYGVLSKIMDGSPVPIEVLDEMNFEELGI